MSEGFEAWARSAAWLILLLVLGGCTCGAADAPPDAADAAVEGDEAAPGEGEPEEGGPEEGEPEEPEPEVPADAPPAGGEEDACDPFAPDCGEGLACATEYPSYDAWRCDEPGALPEHALCGGDLGSCAAGLLCTTDEEFDVARCFAFCDPGAADTCGGGRVCLPEEEIRSDPGEGGGGVHLFGLCVAPCAQPATNDCPDGFTCTDLGEPFDGLTVCLGAGGRELGASCTLDQGQCAPGLHCALGRCGRPCPEGPCPDGEECYRVPDDGIAICAAGCDPAAGAAAACPGDLACIPHPADPSRGVCGRGGDAEELDPCSGTSDCRAGLLCAVDEHDRGRCHRPCDPSSGGSACGDGSRCVPEPDDGPRAGLCRPGCTNPVVNDCPDGYSCVGLGDEAGGGVACFAAGPRGEGETCTADEGECAPGLVCADRCLRPCDPAAPACAASEVCAKFPEDLVGYCLASCTEEDDCADGFSCDRISDEEKREACVPLTPEELRAVEADVEELPPAAPLEAPR